jgi:Mrp family chromosome partitioning ATPase
MVAAIAILAAGAGFGLSLLQPVLYEAQGELLVADPRTSGVFDELSNVFDPSRYVRNQARIIESTQVATAAAETLGGTISVESLKNSTTASPARDLDVILVKGTQPTASEAVELVNAVVGAYASLVTEQVQTSADNRTDTLQRSKTELQGRVAQLDAALDGDPENAALTAERNAAVAQLVTLDTQIDEITVNAALYGSGVQLYVPPETPRTPVQPKTLRNTAIAGLLGFMAGAALAWWRGDKQERAEDRNIPARVLDAPLLGAVPNYWEVGATGPAPSVSSPQSAAAGAYDFVVSSLGFALSTTDGNVVMVTSSGIADGKTASALNIAVSATGDGRAPLLVDGDERNRGLTRMSGFAIGRGVTDFEPDTDPNDLVQKWQVEGGTVIEFLPAGRHLRGDTAQFFRSDQFRDALPKLSAQHDLVIIDAPPVLAAPETTDIAAQVDGVVLVVRYGTDVQDIEDARDRLAIAGTPIIGYIFNRAKGTDTAYVHGYGYGYTGS